MRKQRQNFGKIVSNNHLVLAVVFAERLWRHTFLALEDAVEVRHIVETAVITNLGYRHGGINKFARRYAKPDVDDVFRYGLASTQLEKSAECRRSHAHDVGERLQPDVGIVMPVDVLFHFLHPAAVGTDLDMGKGTARQQMVIAVD